MTVDELKASHRRSARVQPHDGPPRLPSGRHLSRDRRDADHAPSSKRPSTSTKECGLRHRARDHDSAGWRSQGAEVSSRTSSPRPPTRSSQDAGIDTEVHGRHHDRDPARCRHRRRDRQGSRVLLLRHQRPDPDDLRLLPRRRRQVPRATTTTTRSTRAIPSPSLDQNGVGKLVEMAAKLGRQTRPDIKLGICGEHGGDPTLRRVLPQSWPELRPAARPFRVPIARSGCRSRLRSWKRWASKSIATGSLPFGEELLLCVFTPPE